MTASITLFAALTAATGQELDDDLTLVSAQAPIPCSAAGTNAITLTQQANVYPVAAYTNHMQLSAVATGTNTTNTTARLGSLPTLSIFKDSPTGPVQLGGGEIVTGNAFTLMYDIALNGGVGGFHLFTNTGTVNTAGFFNSIVVGAGQTLNRYLTATASVSFSVFGANSAQEVVVAVPGVLANDAIQVGPPSMALAAVSFLGYVTASGSVNLRGVNAAGATVSVAPGIFRVTAMG